MYGKRELTSDNIRSRVSSFDLFSYYCEPFKEVNLKFCSELRKDTYPTCSIQAYEGRLFYKDFATGESFDDIGYIQKKYNVDFLKALAFINRDFNLDLSGQLEDSLPTMAFFGIPDKSIDIHALAKETAQIKVQIRPWDKVIDGTYWKDKYGFTVAQLKYFNIFPIKYFWINNKLYSGSKNTYGYYFGTEEGLERWKIYQPLGPKDKKWFSNIGKTILQGYKQLPDSGDLLFITSSLKDVVTLRKLGFYAIAPSAESTIIPEDIIAELKRRFKHVVIFYDNDDPGIVSADKHSKLYDVKSISVPITSKTKDPSDFVEKYNYEELLKIIKDELC
jgi:hypothetical protein